MDKVLQLLSGLDMAHSEVVHSQLLMNHFDAGLYLLTRLDEVAAYQHCCQRFFQQGDSSQLPEMNRLVAAILSQLKARQHEFGAVQDLCQSALSTIQRLAGRDVRTFRATLGDAMQAVWQQQSLAGSDEQLSEALSPFLDTISQEVQHGAHEDAAGNLYGLFGWMARTKQDHEDWFVNMMEGGDVSDIVWLTDDAAEVYSDLRQNPSLPGQLAEDMDIRLTLFNHQTGLFGDWSLSSYSAMLGHS